MICLQVAEAIFNLYNVSLWLRHPFPNPSQIRLSPTCCEENINTASLIQGNPEWPLANSWECYPQSVLYVMIDDFVTNPWSNRSSYIGFSGCFINTKVYEVCLMSLLEFWVLIAKPGCRAGYAYVTSPHKSLGTWGSFGLPQTKTFHTRPYSWVLTTTKSILVWPWTKKVSKAHDGPLWYTLLCLSFLLHLLCILSCNNPCVCVSC